MHRLSLAAHPHAGACLVSALRFSSAPRVAAVVAIATIALWSNAAQAQTNLTWDVNGAVAGTGGTGTWDTTTAVWFNGSAFVPWTNGTFDNAIFGGTAGAVTVSGSIDVHNLTFNTAGYTIGGGTLNLGGATPTITGSGTINSVLAGTAGLTTGGGANTLTLSGANTFTGPLLIAHGIVLFNNGSVVLAPGGSLATSAVTLGTAPSSGPLIYAVLQNQANNQLTNATLTFNAISGRWSYWQLLSTTQSVVGIVDSGGAGVIENTEQHLGFGNGTLALTGSGSYSYNGIMRDSVGGSGTLALVKNGTGTQTLSGTNLNYTGPTTVNGGTLALSDTSNYRSGTTMNAGATLVLAGSANISHPAGFTLALNNGATLTKTNSGFNAFDSSNVAINGAVAINVTNSGINNQLFIGGASSGLTGSGTINLTNTGAATTGVSFRSNSGNFSGAMNVNGGVVNIGSGSALVLRNTDLNLTNGARLNLLAAFGTSSTNASVKSLAGNSSAMVNFGGGFPLILGINNGTGATFAGVISGSSPLIKTGTGTQTLAGNNTYTGTTSVNAGQLVVNGSQPSSAVSLNGGVLGGTGTVGNITATATGGGLAPGEGTGTGILTSANVTLNNATTFSAALNGVMPGSGYDQLNVAGTVNLGGATLSVTAGFAVPPGSAFTLINNDGADPVVGTFAGLPEGSTVIVGGQVLSISYAGGTGNDVVLSPPASDVAITKSGPASIVPGTSVVYTIVVTNNGPNGAASVLVTDPTPAGLTFVGNAGDCTTAFPCDLGTLADGATRTITATFSVPSDYTTPDPVVNTASVTTASVDPVASNDSATTTTPVASRADLTISKASAPNPYVPGDPLTYTIIVSNVGPSDAPNATVQDTFPGPLAAFTWTCTPNTPGATCGASGGPGGISDTVTLPTGGSVTYSVTGTAPPGSSIVLTNVATVTPPSGVLDPVPGNNTAQDVNNAQITADLRISKAGTPTPFVPGETLTYTIVVSNAGPSTVTGARVQDALPPAFAAFTWTCTPSVAASCQAASGVGDINVLVDLAAGTSATFASTGTVPPGFTSAADNSATVTPPPDTRDPTPGNNTSTYANPPNLVADLAIAKAQSPTAYVPGGPLTYTLQVTNLGPSDVVNARVQDVLPGVLTGVSWTCQASGTAASCSSSSGMHVVDALVTVPVGTTVTFTISGTVSSSAVGVLTNTATVAAPSDVTDPAPGNNTAAVNSDGALQSDLAIVKTASLDPYTPGAPLTYTIVVRNNGPSDALNARVQDLFPAPVSGFAWTCAPSLGAATCGVASGQTLIDVFVDLPAGGAVAFTATGTVPADTTGALTNTATVTPPVGATDPTPDNNTSTLGLGAQAVADLSLTKTSSPNPYVPGTPITYTIVATNAGPSALLGARVQDGLPAVLQNVQWTCVAIHGTCPAPSGTGNLDALVGIEPGGTVTFTITADVPLGTNGSLVNAATVVPPPGGVDPIPSNNTGTNFNPSLPPGGPADLQIAQEFPAVAPPNGLLTFRLVTKNLGSHPALNPYVTGLIPPGTTFVSVNPGPGGIANTPGNPPAPDPVTGYPIPGAQAEPLKVTWPGLMRVGDSHVVEFTVRVAPGTPTGQILWSCFWTWSETEDPYHADNVVDAYLFVNDGTSPVGDLQVQAAAAVVSESSPDRSNGGHFGDARTPSYETIGTALAVRVGADVPTRFWVTNHGPAASRGQYALILDTANTIAIVDADLSQGWVSPSGPSSAVWDTGLVQPGQTVTFDLTVKLLTPSAVELFAQRISGSPGDPNATNERATIVLDGYAPGMSGRWVAVGNVDGAGAGEILTGAGQGETPQVRVFTGTGSDTGVRFFAYERSFTGGVQIASCDVNGDGVAELITAPGPGRAPTIRVLSLVGGVVTELIAFEAFEAGFLGGGSVACADLDADGAAEVVIGAGAGRAPEVQVYNVGLSTVTPRASFLAYEAGFLGGVRVAAGVYPGRPGWLEAFGIATTPGPGRAPELRLFTPLGAPVAQVVVSSATKGVLPTLGDVNGDGQLDLLLAPDDGRPELVRIFEIDSGEVLGDVPGNLPGFPVGIRTAVGVLTGGPGQPEIVIGNGPGGHPRVRVIYWPASGPVQRLEILPLEIP